jgi:hypothetical protein
MEAGHRCAIPTCRHTECDIHYIIPWEQCKKHEHKNLIALCPNCHRLANEGKIDRKSLHIYKANLRFVFEKYSHFEIDVLFELSKDESKEGLLLDSSIQLLVRRIVDAGFVQIIKPREGGITWASVFHYDYGKRQYCVASKPYPLVITDAGREFIQSLSTKDIGY